MTEDFQEQLMKMMRRIEKANNEEHTFIKLFESKMPTDFGWLGGRPFLPSGVLWPKLDGQICRFIAQFDCSKLPSKMWDGLGPRDGWLSVFGGYKEDYMEFVILHNNEKGNEVAPISSPSNYVGEDYSTNFEAQKTHLMAQIANDSKNYHEDKAMLGVIGGRPEESYPDLLVIDPLNVLILELKSNSQMSWGGTYSLAITVPRNLLSDGNFNKTISDISN